MLVEELKGGLWWLGGVVFEGGGAAVGQGWFRVVFHKRDAGGGGGQSPLDNKLVEGSKSYSHGLTNNTFKCFGVFFCFIWILVVCALLFISIGPSIIF